MDSSLTYVKHIRGFFASFWLFKTFPYMLTLKITEGHAKVTSKLRPTGEEKAKPRDPEERHF
jgi:hypothetical protein